MLCSKSVCGIVCLLHLMDLRTRYSMLASAHGFKNEVYSCLARLLWIMG